MLSPINFIPMAEETGLIVPIGDWVLHEACRQNKAWQDAGLPPMTVCVNVSARQFREKSLIDRVVSALKDSGLDAKYLELELTESMIMQDVEQAVATMEDLQGLGVHLSIDDFGTGYSSLSALKNFPVVRLKIDKSFINDLRHQRERQGRRQRRDFLGTEAQFEGHRRGRRNRRASSRSCAKTIATKCRAITSASRSRREKSRRFSRRGPGRSPARRDKRDRLGPIRRAAMRLRGRASDKLKQRPLLALAGEGSPKGWTKACPNLRAVHLGNRIRPSRERRRRRILSDAPLALWRRCRISDQNGGKAAPAGVERRRRRIRRAAAAAAALGEAARRA